MRNKKIEKHFTISASISGGLMLGVGVPVLIASKGRLSSLLLSIAMIFVGVLLVYFCRKVKEHLLVNKILLSIHILLACIILGAILWHKPHLFVIGWSVVVVSVSIYGWSHLPSRNIA